MRAERAVDAAAFDTKYYTQVDGYPFGFRFGSAIGTPSVALVVITYYLEELRWIFLEAVALCAHIYWP